MNMAETLPIAIVGLGGRFPGDASSPGKLWDMCLRGDDGWSKVPASKFNHDAFYHPDQFRSGAVSRPGLTPVQLYRQILRVRN